MYYYSNFRPLIKYCNGYKKKISTGKYYSPVDISLQPGRNGYTLGSVIPPLQSCSVNTHIILYSIYGPGKKKKSKGKAGMKELFVTTMETVS